MSAAHAVAGGDDHDVAASTRVTVQRWHDGHVEQVSDVVAEEIPVAMVYNGISHAVMLASPLDLEAFGLGFSLTEGIIADQSELYGIEIVTRCEGIELQMEIAQMRFMQLKEKRRSMTGRTGCGLCGAESLQHVVRHPAPVAEGLVVTRRALQAAFRHLAAKQPLQGVTGAVHAAGWASPQGEILLAAEDIGRHNALDKLIGQLARQTVMPDSGFAVVTSRASYEMVQKAASYGISLLAAISAPTALAIRLAQDTALTLVGFARSDSHVVYANAQRIVD